LVLLLSCACLLAAKSRDLNEYAGEEFGADQGLVVIRVVRIKSEGSTSLAMSREDKSLIAVFMSVDGKQKFLVNECDQLRALLLPAGRWYVEHVRTARERDLPKFVQKDQAKIRSFEVVGGSINYAGQYNARFTLESDGRQNVDVNVDYSPDLVKEAAEAFPQAFASKPLLYCPVGRKCKPPSEFNF
jgi:hypothetical protein